MDFRCPRALEIPKKRPEIHKNARNPYIWKTTSHVISEYWVITSLFEQLCVGTNIILHLNKPLGPRRRSVRWYK